MVFVVPEAHFITRFDAEFVAQFLWNHNLSLGPDAMSHTNKYNRGEMKVEGRDCFALVHAELVDRCGRSR